jgi:hypothetical protein
VSRRINWDEPTEQDKARFAAALLAGTPIERCHSTVWVKGNRQERCPAIARWMVNVTKYTPPTYSRRVETQWYCTKHMFLYGKPVDAATGLTHEVHSLSQYKDIVREVPDWR